MVLITAKPEIYPFIVGVFFSIIIVALAAIIETIGRRNNDTRWGVFLQGVGIVVQVCVALYLVWNAYYLVTIPFENRPVDLSKITYIFVEVFIILTLFLFVVICLTVVVSWIIVLFSKKKKREKLNRKIYKNILKLVKGVIISGVIIGGIVVSQSSLYYNGIRGKHIVSLVVMSIIVMSVLLILPFKIESAQEVIEEKKKATRKLKFKRK